MRERHSADDKARHDLVANAEHQGGVKGIVAEGDSGAHGDDVTRKQRQLHAGAALRHPIAHGGHATGDLRGGAELARHGADLFRVVVIGLMRRQHVVIGGDDADIGHGIKRGLELFIIGRGGDHMGVVGAGQFLAARLGRFETLGARHELFAQRLAARDNAFGNFDKLWVEFSHGRIPLSRPDEFDGRRTLREERTDRRRVGIGVQRRRF